MAVPVPRTSAPPGLGLLKGLAVTLKHMLRPAVTQQYPHVKPDLPPRTRGVIALMEENCTVCMLCARECPDWCIYIDSHKETVPPAREGGRPRTRNVLDRFAIDFALCMYCGICVEVCPFDALYWSPEFEYSVYSIDELTHEKERLRAWMDTVPPPPPLEEGAEPPPEVASALATVAKRMEEARQQAIAQQQAAAQAETAGPARAPEVEEIHVEAEIDQAVFDELIAQGVPERVARAKAKAAYVRRRKAEIRAERAAAAAAGPPPAAGAPEPAEPAAEARPEPGAEAAAAPATQPAAPARPADIHIEDAGQIDQETYDQLIAQGVSERVARAKAKAAYVRKRKRELLEGDGT